MSEGQCHPPDESLGRGDVEMKSLYGKYNVTKADGTPTDPDAQYFVLRIDTDRCARISVMNYALLMEGLGEIEFAEQLRDWVMEYERKRS